jgi:hypothetical protein
MLHHGTMSAAGSCDEGFDSSSEAGYVTLTNSLSARITITDWNSIAHTNSGILCSVISGARMFRIVVRIFIDILLP